MIDIFTKHAVVVPLKSKHGTDVLVGMFEAMTQIGKIPEIKYSDDERALSTKSMVDSF